MTKFTDLKLDPKVLKAVTEAGYDNPTPIQAGAIPPALEGRDVLGIAQTGTGKTAGFTLPMITLLGRGRARARMPRSLVLCPTRELAAQVAENFDTYSKYTKLTKALLIGGVSFSEQDKLIDRGVDVLIATPGRLLDHFERGKLLLTGVQIMVVDEADRMLDMGFIPDIERIFQLTPFTRQTLFFSATMAPEIERITNTFLNAPERIEVARQATTSETITQRLIELTPTRKDQTAKQKRELLRALIDAEGDALTNAIIFCNRKTDVDIVAKSLKSHGYDASPIHGDLDQGHRTRTLEGFRDGKLRLLVASDVAARGLDIPAVSHVFNFDLPSHAEDYVHRIGRTGRAGRLGTAVSIATPADDKLLAAIENLVKQTLPRADAPEGFSLSEAAHAAPQPREERRNGRNGRRRNGRRDEDHRGETPRADHQAEPARAEAPQVEAPAETQPDLRRDDHRPDRRDAQRDNRHRGRGRDDSRGAVVVGMGDHIPEFMLAELRRALISASSDSAPDETVEPAQDTVTDIVTDAAAEPSARPRRSRNQRDRARRNDTPTQAETQTDTVVDTAAAEPVSAEANVESPASQQPIAGAETQALAQTEPVTTPTAAEPTAQAPVADAAPEVETAAEIVAEPEVAKPAPKPRRTRRSKVEPLGGEVQAAPAPDAAPEEAKANTTPEEPATIVTPEPEPEAVKPAPKPRATRSRKVAVPAADAPAATEATADAAAPAKPKRTRRTKAEIAASAEAAAGEAAETKPEAAAAKPKRAPRRKKVETGTDETPPPAENPSANAADPGV